MRNLAGFLDPYVSLFSCQSCSVEGPSKQYLFVNFVALYSPLSPNFYFIFSFLCFFSKINTGNRIPKLRNMWPSSVVPSCNICHLLPVLRIVHFWPCSFNSCRCRLSRWRLHSCILCAVGVGAGCVVVGCEFVGYLDVGCTIYGFGKKKKCYM